mgnify:CR=1 FL=1|jgi:hypothetical protein
MLDSVASFAVRASMGSSVVEQDSVEQDSCDSGPVVGEM